MTLWEKDQRRFLFFWHDKLYKQFIAFNAEHPVFAGKSFDDFAKLIQNRYGPAEMKFTQMRPSDDMKLDHLEWPASGDYQLYAIDQSELLRQLLPRAVPDRRRSRDVEKARTEHNTKPAQRQRAHRRRHAAAQGRHRQPTRTSSTRSPARPHQKVKISRKNRASAASELSARPVGPADR